MQIRVLRASEGAAVIALWRSTVLTRPWNPPEEDFRRAVDGPTSAVLGGFVGDELVATAMVGHDGHRGWINYLAVDPSRQRNDLGTAMTTAAEAWLAEQGAVKVQLMVRRSNEPARAFYEHLGYEEADVIVLARWITPPDSAK